MGVAETGIPGCEDDKGADWLAGVRATLQASTATKLMTKGKNLGRRVEGVSEVIRSKVDPAAAGQAVASRKLERQAAEDEGCCW